MLVNFSQVYIEPGIWFPFSHHFQNRLSEAVTERVMPSDTFLSQYGSECALTINVSAKKALRQTEVRGPAVFRGAKDVEYTVFLPYSAIVKRPDAPRVAVKYLLDAACDIFESLDIDTTRLRVDQSELVTSICSDATALAEPTWDESANRSRARRVFDEFFRPKQRD